MSGEVPAEVAYPSPAPRAQEATGQGPSHRLLHPGEGEHVHRAGGEVKEGRMRRRRRNRRRRRRKMNRRSYREQGEQGEAEYQ